MQMNMTGMNKHYVHLSQDTMHRHIGTGFSSVRVNLFLLIGVGVDFFVFSDLVLVLCFSDLVLVLCTDTHLLRALFFL